MDHYISFRHFSGIYFSVGLGLQSMVGRSSLGLPHVASMVCVQPSFLHSPYFNFSHRLDFNVADAAHSTIAIVGHDELMMTNGRRGREVEILMASWWQVRRQSGETSVRAWIGVSERPVQSIHRPHIRVRNVIRARWPIHYPCTTRCNINCQISSRVSERVSEWMNESWRKPRGFPSHGEIDGLAKTRFPKRVKVILRKKLEQNIFF